MKICIFGAGGIGGLLAHSLTQLADVELCAIARGDHLKAIRENGLTLLRDGERHTLALNASDSPGDFGPQDVVISCLKTHQAWESAEMMTPLLGPETAVVTCQNGMPWWYFHNLDGPFANHRLDSVDRDGRQWAAIGPERVIGTSVYPAMEVVEPGVIRHTYSYKIFLGEPSGEISERIVNIADVLKRAGFDTPILDDIRSEIWLKLWGNLCFNPISALTRATLDVVISDPPTRALCRRMMLEAQDIGEKLGATFRVDVDRRIEGTRAAGAHRTSMLQDVDKGKAMEIDAVVTSIQEMGRITGIETPTVDMVLGLVQQLGRAHGLYPTYPEIADERASDQVA